MGGHGAILIFAECPPRVAPCELKKKFELLKRRTGLFHQFFHKKKFRKKSQKKSEKNLSQPSLRSGWLGACAKGLCAATSFCQDKCQGFEHCIQGKT